MKLLSERT
jgi:chromosome segregation ATPase